MSLKAHPDFRLLIFHKIALLGLLDMLLLGGIDYRATVHIDSAARTCQHGKGSAVVAKEVHNLAARSAKAAQETGELIESSVEINGTGASNQQAEVIVQVNIGLMQID